MKRHIDIPGKLLLSCMITGSCTLWAYQYEMKGLTTILGLLFLLLFVIGASKVKVFYTQGGHNAKN